MTKHMSRTRKFLGSIFRIRSWLDLDRLSTITQSLLKSASKLFTPPKRKSASVKTPPNAQQVEAFKDAAEKYHLDDKELNQSAHFLLYWSYCLILFAVVLMAFFIYYLLAGSLKAGLLTLIGIGLAVVLAFRYHFFYYQIKERKLGCTVKEWFQVGLLGRQ